MAAVTAVMSSSINHAGTINRMPGPTGGSPARELILIVFCPAAAVLQTTYGPAMTP